MERITMQESEFEFEEEIQNFPYNDQKIALFLKDISAKELLTAEQEKEQARKIESCKASNIRQIRTLLQQKKITATQIICRDWIYEKMRGRAWQAREKSIIFFAHLVESEKLLKQELSREGKGWLTQIPIHFFLILDENIQDKKLSDLTNALMEARNDFCERNLLFVVWVVKRYYHYSYSELEFLELVNEGAQGLQTAIDKFNWREGHRLSASAVWWIKQQIGRALERNGGIKIPQKQHWLRKKITKVRNKRLQETGDYPSLEEIAEDLEVPPSEIQAVFKLPKVVLSLDQPAFLEGDETETYGDLIGAASDIGKEVRLSEVRDLIDEALSNKLSERDKAIVKYRLMEGRPLEKVSAQFNISRQRVWKIVENGKRILRFNPKIYQLWQEFQEES